MSKQKFEYMLVNSLAFILAMCLLLLILWLVLWQELTRIESERIYPQIEFIDFKYYSIDEEELYIAQPPDKILKLKYRSSLSPRTGVCYGPSGKETFYNLPMDRVVQTMRNKGYTEDDYPYIEREDGVKCLGDYVIVAASLEKYKRGQIIETSLGQGIVCDTGEFALNDIDQIDIAVTW